MIAQASNKITRAFSLVEVVIAIGVAATGLVVVLALLPGLLEQNATSRHAQVALGLPDAITIELRKMAEVSLTTLGSRAADFSAEASSLQLVAAEDGTDLRDASLGDTRPAFFLVELHRFPVGTQLSYNSSTSYLALQARISWPHRPNGDPLSEVARNSRHSVKFNVILNR